MNIQSYKGLVMFVKSLKSYNHIMQELIFIFQITISYIDEDLTFEERQASLADYGFKCVCAKCLEESRN